MEVIAEFINYVIGGILSQVLKD